MLKENSLLKNSGYGITAFLFTFSYSLAFAASLQLDMWYAVITAVTALIISISLKSQILAPDTFFTVPLLLVLSSGTNALLPFCVITGGLIYFSFNKKFEKVNFQPAISGAIALSLAFSVTALLTTHYFGIGAKGFTVPEILKTYRSLGFHPNWRGVFYGTITLFSMITYPFKFKRANKYFPAECFSLVLPLILNLILNPVKEYTPINEVSNLFDFWKQTDWAFFLPFLNTNSQFTMQDYINAFQGAISLGALLLILKPLKTRTDSNSTADILNGIQGGFPVRAYKIRGYSLISAIIAVILVIFSCIFFDTIIMRIPLHSFAVVLIVNAWKQVPFKTLGNGFKSGVFSIISIILIFVSSVMFNFFTTLILAIILNALIPIFKIKGGAENG